METNGHPVDITDLEREEVLKAFEELKRRGRGEMRVAIERDDKTGAPEIVYIGVHQKADLRALRQAYDHMKKLRANRPVRFGVGE